MRNTRCFSLVITLFAVAPAIYAQPGLKVMVLYDMEGVSGATEFKHSSASFPTEYAVGRQSLTDDVNAAISGLKAAGATEIIVVDGHGSGNTDGPDILEEKLLPPARMINRNRPFDIYMDSYDHSFDAIIAIGMHAGAGNGTGFLPHTYSLVDVGYKVNGIPFNEAMLLAAGAGRLKIPLIMVSGDDQLEREIRRNMPWVKYATVKQAVSRGSAKSFSKSDVEKVIEVAAREGLKRISEAKIPEWAGPYRFALTFQDEAQARNAALLPGAEYVPGTVHVQVRANDFEEGYRQSVRLIGLASQVAQNSSRTAVINARPDVAEINRAVTEQLFERFLGKAAASTAVAPHRYWGAR